MTQPIKLATCSSALLLGVSTLMGVTALAPGEAQAAPESVTGAESQNAQAASDQLYQKQTAAVTGQFAYDQNVTTASDSIRDVFAMAAATLCASVPDYGATSLGQAIDVRGPHSYALSPSRASEDADNDGFLLACSCATNVAGGGAIANAHVQGVTVASVASTARAR